MQNLNIRYIPEIHDEILNKIMKISNKFEVHFYNKWSGSYKGLVLVPNQIINILQENGFELFKCNPEKYYEIFKNESSDSNFINWYISLIEKDLNEGYASIEIEEDAFENTFLDKLLDVIWNGNLPYMDSSKCGYIN